MEAQSYSRAAPGGGTLFLERFLDKFESGRHDNKKSLSAIPSIRNRRHPSGSKASVEFPKREKVNK